MTQVIEVREYATATVELREDEARALVRAAAGRLTLAPGSEPQEYTLKATQWVGTIVLPEIEVLIRPKVSFENLFMMLDHAPPEAIRSDTFGFDTSERLLPAIASFFSRLTDHALQRGVLRSYRQERQRLQALRGRIDIREQIRRPGVEIPVACIFDEFTADNIENRTLRAAARRLLLVPGVAPAVRRRLRLTVAQLEDVEDTPPSDESIDRIVFHRLNAHYEPSVRLAAAILRNLTLVDRAGATSACAFLVDMNSLFESFLTARLGQVLGGQLNVEAQLHRHLDRSNRVLMKPDLIFMKGENTVYVGDIKYKRTETGKAGNADYYQLLAYTTALNLPEGVLIYCTENRERVLREVTVQIAGKRLYTYGLPITGTREQVDESIAELGNWITRQAFTTALVA